MPMKGKEFTVEMGNGMPMSVYVKRTDIEGKHYSLSGIVGQRQTRLIVVSGNLNAQRYVN